MWDAPTDRREVDWESVSRIGNYANAKSASRQWQHFKKKRLDQGGPPAADQKRKKDTTDQEGDAADGDGGDSSKKKCRSGSKDTAVKTEEIEMDEVKKDGGEGAF